MRTLLRYVAIAGVTLALAACQTANQPKLIESQKSSVELRVMQSRAFDTTDRDKTLRAVISTLQDLGYSIDKVEPPAGTVTGTKLSQLRLTATVYPRGSTQTIVRANAIVWLPQAGAAQTQVDDPRFYQLLFFEPLAKAMFLSALQVEDPGEPTASAGGDAAAPAPQSATNSK
jgi:hypothetical protein